MTDIEKARELFKDAGLGFPVIPRQLALKLMDRDRWLFSTRRVTPWPNDIRQYVEAANKSRVRDYVVLAHSGHGINSYAIHYYLVYGSLQMFLQLAWGGVYMDPATDVAKINECFSTADQLVKAAERLKVPRSGNRLTVVGSDFYGGYWAPPGKSGRWDQGEDRKPSLALLREALNWLSIHR